MPEFHAEPYVYLAGLSHKGALIAWGAFYFKVRSDGRHKIVDDEDLQWVHPPRCESIGCRSDPYGPARVEVYDESGALVASALTNCTNHCAVSGLQPNTRYRYSVTVKHEIWGQGVRWDWDPRKQGLAQNDRVYRNEFRTLPDPQAPLAEPFSFIVIGDFGVGIRKPSSDTKRQLEVAQALVHAVDLYDARLILTTGDNIYAQKRFLLWTGDSGDEDDDWFFTYFQPYRYALNRIPVCPSIGNHDTQETEEHDDRDQVMDNMYLRERLAGEEAAGRASIGPGLFYKFKASADIEFVCIDTSKEHFFRKGRIYEYPKHWEFMEAAFPPQAESTVKWRIPFGHHPPYCAGPQHHNTRGMGKVVDLFRRSGVRVSFAGHEHNFQHASVDGIDYFVSGAGAKIRRQVPDRFAAAHTQTWSGECHFLLCTIDGDRMTVRAIGDSPADTLLDIPRFTPSGESVQGPIEVGHTIVA